MVMDPRLRGGDMVGSILLEPLRVLEGVDASMAV